MPYSRAIGLPGSDRDGTVAWTVSTPSSNDTSMPSARAPGTSATIVTSVP